MLSPNSSKETSEEPSVCSTPVDPELKASERNIEALKMVVADLRSQLDQQSMLATSRNEELEFALSEAKVDKSRLLEKLESYQVLLQERTLNGDYSIMNLSEDIPNERTPSRGESQVEESGPLGTLACELREAEAEDAIKSIGIQFQPRLKVLALQSEIRHLRESNKAMTLYINEIIGRLLQTKGFEHVLEKEAQRPISTASTQSHFANFRRPHENRASVDMLARRPPAAEFSSHHRLSMEITAPSIAQTGSGLSRAFSFRRKPEMTSASTNLRPLKLVEEQHPNWRGENRIHSRARTQGDEAAESGDSKTGMGKRASWVPGWFNKAAAGNAE
jgi:hypothetical protein